MSRIPGAFDSDSESEHYSTGDLDLLMTDGGDSSEDPDYSPPHEDGSTEGETIMEDSEEEQEGEQEEEEGGADNGPLGGNVTIGYDSTSRQLLLIDANGNHQRLTNRHLRGSTATLATLRNMLAARFGGTFGGADDDEEEEEEDDEDAEESEDDGGSIWGPTRRVRKSHYEVPKEPQLAGLRIQRSGDFGAPSKQLSVHKRKFGDYSPNLATSLRSRDLAYGRPLKTSIGDLTIPNSSGTEVAQFASKVYSGQYSSDGRFFYAACQDFHVYIYDTRNPPRVGNKTVTDTQPTRRYGGWDHRSSLKTIKIVKAQERNCRWTITDAELSPDNEWLLYSSITPRVHLVRTGEGTGWSSDDHEQTTLDFAGGMRSFHTFGIWSVRFSNDAKEVVAGANDGQIFVWDIEANRTVLGVKAHLDDVNAVAFADVSSPHLLLSGSDDSFVKVWDRRSLSGERPSGTLVGHTQGVTHISPKGDGRYCLSNGKDQGAKLWDLRKMMSDVDFDRLRLDRKDFGITNWDYRQSYYPKPRHVKHPHDVSVMTYRGHSVLRTLIRCHFSPVATTNQQYLYSGSSDGKIHIWSLDGRVVQVLDRRLTHSLINQVTGEYNDPSAPDLSPKTKGGYQSAATVRDVSWHPSESSLMSTSWGSANTTVEGSLAKHEWKSVVGETLEDQVERARLESLKPDRSDSLADRVEQAREEWSRRFRHECDKGL